MKRVDSLISLLIMDHWCYTSRRIVDDAGTIKMIIDEL